MKAAIQPSEAAPPQGLRAFLAKWGPLLFKAWITPQRLCGCRPPRPR